MTQPDIQAATVRLKSVLASEIYKFTIKGRTLDFHFTYASGMSGEHLTSWLKHAKSLVQFGVTVVIVLGDDSVIIYKNNEGKIMYIEIDYSHYDQSQKAVQTECEHQILRALGVRNSVLDILKEVSSCSASFSIRSPKINLKIRVKPSGPTRVTGGPNTSLSNSTNNILSIVIARFSDFEEHVWKTIGFEAKIKRADNIQDVTFLHGTWWPYSDGTERWGILPSACIKLGKTMSPKRSIRNLLQIAYGQGLGMGVVPQNFPILSSFRKILIKHGSKFRAVTDSYHPISDFGQQVDRGFVLEWMQRRYGVEESEILQAESDIDSVPSLPYFIGNRLFLRFQLDY
jgi:hypothetical protein